MKRVNRVVDRCSIASRLARYISLDARICIYIYIERELFPFFFFSIGRRSADPRAPCRPGHRQSPLSFPQPRYIRSSTRARFSGRGKFRPTSSSQPLYSTVLQLVFERNSAADRGRHKVFSVRHLEWYRESFVNGGEIDFMRIIGYDRWRMMRKICKPLFHLSRFRGFVIVYWNVGK